MGGGFDSFKDNFYRFAKLDLNKYRQEQLERRLRSFLSIHFDAASTDPILFDLASKELSKTPSFYFVLLDVITINHSIFFRNHTQWDVLSDFIKNTSLRKLKIWSAGCSSGEEPYTLAMMLKVQHPGLLFEILATDIDRSIIAKAKEGVYEKFSFDNIAPEYLEAFFERCDGKFHIKDEIKREITFKEHNLFDTPPERFFDIIICRNVLIYFTPEGKDLVYKNFSNALSPDGFMFCGPTEQIFTPETYNFRLLKPSFYGKIKNTT